MISPKFECSKIERIPFHYLCPKFIFLKFCKYRYDITIALNQEIFIYSVTKYALKISSNGCANR